MTRLRILGTVFGALLAPTLAFAIAAPRPNFGMPYTVVREPGSSPVVRAGELRIPVSYSGGCGSHSFTPVYRRQTMGSIVWLNHTTTDSCSTAQREWVSVPLPPEAVQMHMIWLFTPGGPNIQVPVP